MLKAKYTFMIENRCYKLICISVVLMILFSSLVSGADNDSPIPASSKQMILVITDSASATKGVLHYYTRESENNNWQVEAGQIPVVLGRSGLGWGRGLHERPLDIIFPLKKEGDGRSPAGVFTLSQVFGYAAAEEMSNLKMQYIHITDVIECIDDLKSRYYNQIVSRSEAEEGGTLDWDSSEKMRNAGIYYELGVVVDHNSKDVKPGGGSCIFLHNWKTPDETMAGCTGMEPDIMHEVIYWLDDEKNPLLVQLTLELYEDLKEKWSLPELPEKQ